MWVLHHCMPGTLRVSGLMPPSVGLLGRSVLTLGGPLQGITQGLPWFLVGGHNIGSGPRLATDMQIWLNPHHRRLPSAHFCNVVAVKAACPLPASRSMPRPPTLRHLMFVQQATAGSPKPGFVYAALMGTDSQCQTHNMRAQASSLGPLTRPTCSSSDLWCRLTATGLSCIPPGRPTCGPRPLMESDSPDPACRRRSHAGVRSTRLQTSWRQPLPSTHLRRPCRCWCTTR